MLIYMTQYMKKAYRMFKRKNRPNYFIQNNATREQRCLGTSDQDEAQRVLDAANQARQAPALNTSGPKHGKAKMAGCHDGIVLARKRSQSKSLCEGIGLAVGARGDGGPGIIGVAQNGG